MADDEVYSKLPINVVEAKVRDVIVATVLNNNNVVDELGNNIVDELGNNIVSQEDDVEITEIVTSRLPINRVEKTTNA